MFAGGSEIVISDVGGVLGISKFSVIGGGGRPIMSVSAGIDVAAIEGSMGASWLGVKRATLGGAGVGLGLLNMLAQLRVPSGFELGCASSFGGDRAASATEISSHPGSKGVSSATAISQLGVVVSAAAGVSHEGVSVAGASSIFAVWLPREPLVNPPLPPRVVLRPRSEPRPRPPRGFSKLPLPRPPRVEILAASEAAPAGSLTFN